VICVKTFNRKDVSTNRCSQITVLNLTRQEGDNAEAMLLRLFAEDWDNNIGSVQYSKCKYSIYFTVSNNQIKKLQFTRVAKLLAISIKITFEQCSAILEHFLKKVSQKT